MSGIEIIICNVLCLVALGMGAFCIFDFKRILKNKKVYDKTFKECSGFFNSWAYMELLDSGLEKQMDKTSNDEYLKLINSFRKSVGLKVLTKDDLKLSLSDI